MSGKDETDLVRDKELQAEQSIAHPLKSNLDHSHDHSNGNPAPINGESSTKSDVQVETVKPSTPSNWVQFENDDDKVSKYDKSVCNYSGSTRNSTAYLIYATNSHEISSANNLFKYFMWRAAMCAMIHSIPSLSHAECK